jgi:hypothetical protein
MDAPPSSPRLVRDGSQDIEMLPIVDNSQRSRSLSQEDRRKIIDLLQAATSGSGLGVLPRDGLAPSTASSVPEGLKSFWSTKIFRVVMFFLFCFAVFGVCTSLLFDNRISNEQFLGVCSSLLFLLSPSPLDLIKNKKK